MTGERNITCSVCGNGDATCVHLGHRDGHLVVHGYTGSDLNTRLRIVAAFRQAGFGDPFFARRVRHPFFRPDVSFVWSPYIPIPGVRFS